MGSPEHESGRDPEGRPLHAVELEEFLLASTPITQAQWRVVARWEPTAGAAWQSPLPLEPSLFQGSNAELLEAEPALPSGRWNGSVGRRRWSSAGVSANAVAASTPCPALASFLRQAYPKGDGAPAQLGIEQGMPGLAAGIAIGRLRAWLVEVWLQERGVAPGEWAEQAGAGTRFVVMLSPESFATTAGGSASDR